MTTAGPITPNSYNGPSDVAIESERLEQLNELTDFMQIVYGA